MNLQHRKLAEGRWAEMSLAEQMANIGSEVMRAISWKEKGHPEQCDAATARALELLDLSLASVGPYPRRREVARLREAVVDYFHGANTFRSSPSLWRSYFDPFNLLARKRFLRDA